MKKITSFCLMFIFFLIGCGKGAPTGENIIKKTEFKEDINTFVSPSHGTVAIFPTYKYLGSKEDSEGKGIRKYYVWEQPDEGKYIMILQLVPKEGTFPEGIDWTPKEGSLFIKGKRAAYNSINARSQKVMNELGAELPPCFILAEEVHVSKTEALFRILIVPDQMCLGNYEPVMQELDRVAIIKPLG
jgi:hypothetical protein